MLKDLSGLKSYFNLGGRPPSIDSWVFRWVKVAAIASLLACILVTATAYFGDNINCINDFQKQAHKAIETYCFIHQTFSLMNFTANGVYAHAGVAPSTGMPEDASMIRHAYYQWVPMVLALQTFALYFPKWFWKEFFEQKKFTSILDGLNKPYMDEADKMKRVHESSQYMAATLNSHTPYALRFLFCEMLAFSISLGNLFFTDAFLGGSFFAYGRGALTYIVSDPRDIDNPLNQVFPKVTKCFWRKFGPGGTLETYDSLCVLPRNIVNEKTYIILWIVFLLSFTMCTIVLTWHLVLLATGNKFRNKFLLKNVKSQEVKSTFGKIKAKLNYGDFFFIKQLRDRMHGPNYEAWIEQFSEEIMK